MSIENFKEDCQLRLGYIEGDIESHKKGKCMIEIISNIGKIEIIRINCERLLTKTRNMTDLNLEDNKSVLDPVLEQAKITQFLLKIRNMKLFEAVHLYRKQ